MLYLSASIPPALCLQNEDALKDRCAGFNMSQADENTEDIVYNERSQPVFVYLIIFQVS